MMRSLNAEFRRNLWLEISWQRLVAMPAVLGSLFLLVIIVSARVGAEGLSHAALLSFYVIAFVWGTRRAAAALADEVRERTWDGQRLSALGPWALSWGKLFGSTAFVWYGAAICLVVYVLADQAPLPVLLKSAALLVLSAILGQCIALGACLTFLRKLGDKVRLPVFFSQLLGLVAAFNHGVSQESLEGYGRGSEWIEWYGVLYGKQDFTLVSLALFTGWALIGLYRQMSGELQQRNLPWVWMAFLFFLLAYVSGFPLIRVEEIGVLQELYLPLIPFVIGLALVYIALFAEPKNLVTYRSSLAAFGRGDVHGLGTLLPLWLLTYLFATALGLVMMWALKEGPLLVGSQRFFEVFSAEISAQWVAACLLFVLRDLGFVLFLNFVKRPQRPDIAALIYLALLYGVGGGISLSSGNPVLPHLFLPLVGGDLWVTVGPVALQVALAWMLVVWRWRLLQPGLA